MNPITFNAIGSGWRTLWFLRVAQARPDLFQCTGVTVRSAGNAGPFAARWKLPTFATPDDLLRQAPASFTLVSLPRPVTSDVVQQLAARGQPVLCETGLPDDPAALNDLYRCVKQSGARVQVAEQVHLRPHHQAHLAVIASGRLGKISSAQVSVAHGYHGISLMRRCLGVTFECPVVRGWGFQTPIVQGAGREGFAAREQIVPSREAFASFDFGDRQGLTDFTGDQYFGLIRRPRLLVRGDRGEMDLDSIVYLRDHTTPIALDLRRHDCGTGDDLFPKTLWGIQVGETWVYRNRFSPACLSDDEIAVAECLERMHAYLESGTDFYSLAEACQDMYLDGLATRSAQTGAPLQAEPQEWT